MSSSQPPQRISIGQLANVPENGRVLRKLLVFSVGMVVVPLATFFVMYMFVVTPVFGAEGMWGSIISGIAAVVAVQVIMILYVVTAMREEGASSASADTRRKVD